MSSIQQKFLLGSNLDAERQAGLRHVYEAADRMLLQQRIDVRFVPGGGPGNAASWTDGSTIFFDSTQCAEIDVDSIGQMHGLNMHEMAHVQFSPRQGSQMLQTIITAGQFRAYNMLEDQRIETMLTARYGATRPWLTATIMRFVIGHADAMPMAFPLIHGRRYLPQALRDEVRRVFAVPDKADDIARVIDEYRRLVFPTDANRAVELVDEFHRLLKDVAEEMGEGLNSFPDPFGHKSSDEPMKNGRSSGVDQQRSAQRAEDRMQDQRDQGKDDLDKNLADKPKVSKKPDLGDDADDEPETDDDDEDTKSPWASDDDEDDADEQDEDGDEDGDEDDDEDGDEDDDEDGDDESDGQDWDDDEDGDEQSDDERSKPSNDESDEREPEDEDDAEGDTEGDGGESDEGDDDAEQSDDEPGDEAGQDDADGDDSDSDEQDGDEQGDQPGDETDGADDDSDGDPWGDDFGDVPSDDEGGNGGGDAGDSPANGMQSDGDQPGDGAGGEGIGAGAGDVEREPSDNDLLSEMAKDLLDQIMNSEAFRDEVERVQKQVLRAETHGDVLKTIRWRDVGIEDSALKGYKVFRKELTRIKHQIEMGWERRTERGRVNAVRFGIEGKRDEAFDLWDEGMEDALDIECVICVDISSSMTYQCWDTFQALWSIKRTLDDFNARTSVIVYGDDSKWLYKPNERADHTSVRYVDANGGTTAYGAVDQALRIMAGSRKSLKILIMLTDGGWWDLHAGRENGESPQQRIERMGKAGIVTALGYITPNYRARSSYQGNPDGNGCQIAQYIAPGDLALFGKAIVNNAIKRRLSKR